MTFGIDILNKLDLHVNVCSLSSTCYKILFSYEAALRKTDDADKITNIRSQLDHKTNSGQNVIVKSCHCN